MPSMPETEKKMKINYNRLKPVFLGMAVVALILSKHPGLTPFEVKAILAAVANNERRAL